VGGDEFGCSTAGCGTGTGCGDRAASSILFNIGEGAGKTARADKQRSYEIARGSATEAATQLDVLHIRGFITSDQYSPRC
jgi:four helix bundle protein